MEEKFTGKGSICYPDGGQYTGDFKDGKRNGSGTMIFSNYDRYEGAWENDKMEGKGEYLFYDLKRDGYSKSYKGDFHDGKIEGRGVFTSQKETFIGEWQRNIRWRNLQSNLCMVEEKRMRQVSSTATSRELRFILC